VHALRPGLPLKREGRRVQPGESAAGGQGWNRGANAPASEGAGGRDLRRVLRQDARPLLAGGLHRLGRELRIYTVPGGAQVQGLGPEQQPPVQRWCVPLLRRAGTGGALAWRRADHRPLLQVADLQQPKAHLQRERKLSLRRSRALHLLVIAICGFYSSCYIYYNFKIGILDSLQYF